MSLASQLVLAFQAVGTAIKSDRARLTTLEIGDPVLRVVKTAGTWPARPTDDPTVCVMWLGATPDPAIITTGTAGMYSGDIRVTY